jgi:uncharacterized protein YpbB
MQNVDKRHIQRTRLARSHWVHIHASAEFLPTALKSKTVQAVKTFLSPHNQTLLHTDLVMDLVSNMDA